MAKAEYATVVSLTLSEDEAVDLQEYLRQRDDEYDGRVGNIYVELENLGY